MTSLAIDTDRLPSECYIKHWSLLGPFALASVSDPAVIKAGEQHDYLSDIGFTEGGFTLADLKRSEKLPKIYKSYRAASALLDLADAYPTSDHAEVYAVAELRSEKDTDIGIEVGSQDGLTLWVNGESILASGGGSNHFAIPYDHFGIAHLKHGRNILVAKINRQSDGGNFLLSFIGAARARDMIGHRLSGNLIHTVLLHSGDPLHVTIPSACLQPITDIRIRNDAGTLFSKAVSPAELHGIKIATIADGYYFMTATSLCGLIEDSFYIGDPATIYRNVVSLRNMKEPNSKEYLSLDVIARRYEILTSSAYSHPTDRSWQMKLLMILKDGSRATIDPGNQQWTTEPGLHLQEYISSIDGTRKHYLICMPDSHVVPAPIVIELPPLLATVRPFLEGGLLSSMDDLEHLKEAANDNHVLIVRFGDRGNLLDAPMADAEFFEVLTDLENKFDIDRRRIYLLGYSEAGRRSLLLAEHYPMIFAGIGTYGALTKPYEGDVSHGRWAQENNVTSLIANLRNVPTIIVNGDRDTINPVENAKALLKSLLDSGVPAKFQIFRYGIHNQPYTENVIIPLLMGTAATPHLHIDYTLPYLNHTMEGWIQIRGREDRQFAMKLKADVHGTDIRIESANINSICVDLKRLNYAIDQAVNLVWNGHVIEIKADAKCTFLQIGGPTRQRGVDTISDGTLAETLAEPFLVVEGTGSTAGDKLRDAFTSMWKEDFFEAPRIKRDIDLTPDDVQQFNLVLIGKPADDSPLSVANVLAARVKSEILSFPDAWQSATDIQEALVLPNPLNVKRSLVFLNLSTSSQNFHPALTGFYDYGFWDEKGLILKSGIFSQREFNMLSISPVEAVPYRKAIRLQDAPDE